MDIDKNIVLVSVACLFKRQKGRSKIKWFLVKPNEDSKWELAKVLVRKGESSVRAAIRMTGEKGAMTTKVLEEVGRAGGVTTVNGKTLPQRYLYYLMILKASSNEAIGFHDYAWFDYAGAVRKLPSKRERQMLKEARKVYRNWKKEKQKEKESEAKKAI
jgi:hypothetical protein